MVITVLLFPKQMVDLVTSTGSAELKVVNTICQATQDRQQAALELTRQVEVMFVLGGRLSANTTRLAELCAAQGVSTFHLESWRQFKDDYIQDKTVAGITAPRPLGDDGSVDERQRPVGSGRLDHQNQVSERFSLNISFQNSHAFLSIPWYLKAQ